MSAVSIRLSDEISQRVQHLADITGRSKAFYLNVLREHLEDIEDLYVAKKRLKDIREGRSKTYTLKEVKKSLGLDR